MIYKKLDLLQITLKTADPKFSTATVPNNGARVRQRSHGGATPGKMSVENSHAFPLTSAVRSPSQVLAHENEILQVFAKLFTVLR